MDSSNFYHDHNKYNVEGKNETGSSIYTDDQPSFQEDDDAKQATRPKPPSGSGSDLGESDNPEMANAKLLGKHAQLQGFSPAEMRFGNDEERAHFEEAILTAEDYLDDAEEELAQKIYKNRHSGEPSGEMEEDADQSDF